MSLNSGETGERSTWSKGYAETSWWAEGEHAAQAEEHSISSRWKSSGREPPASISEFISVTAHLYPSYSSPGEPGFLTDMFNIIKTKKRKRIAKIQIPSGGRLFSRWWCNEVTFSRNGSYSLYPLPDHQTLVWWSFNGWASEGPGRPWEPRPFGPLPEFPFQWVWGGSGNLHFSRGYRCSCPRPHFENGCFTRKEQGAGELRFLTLPPH